MGVIASLLLLAQIAFVSPPPGGQAAGPQWIEVSTTLPSVDRVELSVDGVLAGVARRPPYRVAFDFGTALHSRQITARVFYDAFRRTESATMNTLALSAAESMNVDVVEVPLHIRARRTVLPSDLRLRENDVEQTIRELRPDRGSAHFVFIVDRSLSMADGKLQASLHAVEEALVLLRPDDKASVILFNHNVAQPIPIEQGHTASVLESLGATTPSGGTSLRDAVASINTAERTYAIVISDGGDRNSALSEEEALRRISGTRTSVAAVVFGKAGRFLQQATGNTGGTIVEATRGTVNSRLRAVLTDINSRYLLVYQSHGTRSGWRSITLTSRSRGVEIAASRKGYFAS